MSELAWISHAWPLRRKPIWPAPAVSLLAVSVEIREAEAGEEERLVSLYEWLFAPPGSQPPAWDERRAAVALRQAIDSHDCAVIVAEGKEGELVGICTVYKDLHSVRFG